MGEITTYFSVNLVNRSLKGALLKDIFHIQIYLGLPLVPFICYYFDMDGGHYLLGFLIYYFIVFAVDGIFFYRKRAFENRKLGKLYFSEYGIHIKWPDEEEIITYDYEDILQITIKHYSSKETSPINPFEVFSQLASLNTISFTHSNNIYHFHFRSTNPKDYDKFLFLTRKMIPPNINTKFYSQNHIIVNRIHGELLFIPEYELKDVWNRFLLDLRKLDRIILVICAIALFFYLIYIALFYHPILSFFAIITISITLYLTLYRRYS